MTGDVFFGTITIGFLAAMIFFLGETVTLFELYAKIWVSGCNFTKTLAAYLAAVRAAASVLLGYCDSEFYSPSVT